jgi:replicative DNA helicase
VTAIDSTIGRMPANVEAERSILGAILLDNTLQNEALSTLKADHFFLDAHRRIYQRIADLSETNRPIDIVTLTEELLRYRSSSRRRRRRLSPASLTDGVPRRTSHRPGHALHRSSTR